MACNSPQPRLASFRRPQRALPPSSSSSSSLRINWQLSDNFSINSIKISRRNRDRLVCFRSFVAKDESSMDNSTKYKGINRVSSNKKICGNEAGEGVGNIFHIHIFSSIDSIYQLRKFASSLSCLASQFYRTIIIFYRRTRIPGGVLVNAGLMTSLVLFLTAFEYLHSIPKLGLEPFYFLKPFVVSAALSGIGGWVYVPMVDKLKIHQILREEGPRTHSSKRGTPTMGGLFFIPIGIAVASRMANSADSSAVIASVFATLAFAAIGLTDDLLSCVKGHNYGLSGWVKFGLQAAAGVLFAFWLDFGNTSIPQNMKFSILLPQSFGNVYLGKYYLALTAFCFAAMGNGVNLTDGLDGLAGGVTAWAFIGMSVAVLAISPGLSVFGVSMAGACVGFLFHNRYKASIFMGDTGSLGLGGALAAMASCTGMFFPLLISSGIYLTEVLSVIVQVLFIRVSRKMYGVTRRAFRMSPIHHHFELGGVKEPVIVASAYFISCILALVAGYIGIVSAC